ncbi:MAG: EpsG family protein, partial [Streptococcaceae bacterium]|nr:EpsG family protein [Streptococcaceae bacterium]
ANKSGAEFWVAAIVPIAMFVFVTGSRYGWGNDYLWYRVQFENTWMITDQPVFLWLNEYLNNIGLNYVGGFMVYAFIFIVCSFIFIRSFGTESTYMYCVLIPAALFISTNTIRQGVGTAFILLALVFLHNKKWIFLGIAAIIAYYIHSATAITLAILLGSFFLVKKPIHYAISIPLFLFFTLLYDVSNTAILSDFLEQYITLEGKFQSYIDESGNWFGVNAINKQYTRGTFELIFSSLFYCSLFYMGYLALKIRNDKRIIYIFNVVVVGFMLFNAVVFFELLNRMALTLQMFYFVPVGYIIYVYCNDCKQPESHHAILLKKHFPLGITFIIADILRFWGRFILLNPDADFFWYHFDDYLDPNYFIYQM